MTVRRRIYFHLRSPNAAGLAPGSYTAIADITERADGMVDMAIVGEPELSKCPRLDGAAGCADCAEVLR